MEQGNLNNKERDLFAPVWAIPAPQKVRTESKKRKTKFQGSKGC